MEPIRDEREMAVTHAEFFRLLARVVDADQIQRHDASVQITTDVGSINITLGPESHRKLGLLKLPVTPVTLEFQGYSPEEYAAFMRRFTLSFQKGGG
ncbi:MAG: hypothetical protein ACR2P9_05650 [Gammaproteobacteria bacterium]